MDAVNLDGASGHRGVAPSGPPIRPRVRADDEPIMEIYRGIEWDLPPLSVAEYRGYGDEGAAHGYLEQFVAEQQGKVCGYCVLSASPWAQRRGDYLGSVRVRADCRRQGLGHGLYDLLLDRAQTRAARRLRGWIRADSPTARAFVERRGFRPTGRSHRFARLNTVAASLDGTDRLEGDLRDRGIAIKALAEIEGEEEGALRDLHAAIEAATLLPYAVWLREMTGPGRSLTSAWAALDRGRPVALSWLRRQGEQAAFHEQVGIASGELGREVTRALGMRAVAWARRQGIKWLYTGGTSSLPPDVNRRLGYIPLAARLEVVRVLQV